MTKKDYIKIARVLRENLNFQIHRESLEALHTRKDAIHRLTNDMADMLKQDNPNFEKERFIREVYES